MNYSKRTTWTAWHPRGFGVEIACHSEEMREKAGAAGFPAMRLALPPRVWNTYLVLRSNAQAPEASRILGHFWAQRELLESSRLFQWNGGATFFEHTLDPETSNMCLKVGDDYAHSWDEGRWDCLDLAQMQAIVQHNIVKPFLAYLDEHDL